jgi:hypothetical protein
MDMSHQALSLEADAKPTATGGRLKSFCIGTPHADTGAREIRELIGSGKAFAVLTSISLIPRIARGTNEKEFDEAVAEKVDRMTKLIMASTADAWLIHLPGMIRKHEVFTAEQLIQDMENLDDLTYSMDGRSPGHQSVWMRTSSSLSLSVFSPQARLNGSQAFGLSISLVQEIKEESECSGAA